MTVLLLFALCLQVSAENKLVSIKANNEPLGKVVTKLGQQMGYNVFLSPGIQGTVTTDLDKVPGFGALELILGTQDEELTFKVVDKTIVIGPPEKLQKLPSTLYR